MTEPIPVHGVVEAEGDLYVLLYWTVDSGWDVVKEETAWYNWDTGEVIDWPPETEDGVFDPEDRFWRRMHESSGVIHPYSGAWRLLNRAARLRLLLANFNDPETVETCERSLFELRRLLQEFQDECPNCGGNMVLQRLYHSPRRKLRLRCESCRQGRYTYIEPG